MQIWDFSGRNLACSDAEKMNDARGALLRKSRPPLNVDDTFAWAGTRRMPGASFVSSTAHRLLIMQIPATSVPPMYLRSYLRGIPRRVPIILAFPGRIKNSPLGLLTLWSFHDFLYNNTTKKVWKIPLENAGFQATIIRNESSGFDRIQFSSYTNAQTSDKNRGRLVKYQKYSAIGITAISEASSLHFV